MNMNDIFQWKQGNTASQEIMRYREEYRKTINPAIRQKILDRVDILKGRIARGLDE